MYDLYGDPTDISGARDDARMEMKPTADPRDGGVGAEKHHQLSQLLQCLLQCQLELGSACGASATQCTAHFAPWRLDLADLGVVVCPFLPLPPTPKLLTHSQIGH